MKIVYKFDKEEEYIIPAQDLLIEMKDYRYTFWGKEIKALPNFFHKNAIDLLMLSLAVYGADRTVLRKNAGDGWKRDINIHLPVLDCEKMNSLKQNIEQMLDFLSGDKWTLTFRKREFTEIELEHNKSILKNKSSKINAEQICMFSGGLDSFIGAIDLLEDNTKDTIFVSHYGGGKGVREYQTFLKSKLVKSFGVDEERFFSFYAAPPGGLEDTMRSRSFMFFSHAVAIASCFKSPIKLIIPENGYISLNIPLTYSRLGTSSTRTTHPYYMEMFQRILNDMGLNIEIINPYQFKTKGEMISNCKNKKFLEKNVKRTMSCSHPDIGRMRGESETQHCGTCLPCVIRRAAINKAFNKDNTKYYDFDFTSGDTAKKNLNSYLLGLKKYDENKSYLNIQMSGPIINDIDEYESIYNRGVKEMKAILEKYYEIN